LLADKNYKVYWDLFGKTEGFMIPWFAPKVCHFLYFFLKFEMNFYSLFLVEGVEIFV
jgi:hypothetical protein